MISHGVYVAPQYTAGNVILIVTAKQSCRQVETDKKELKVESEEQSSIMTQ
jgi:hypothetical protein